MGKEHDNPRYILDLNLNLITVSVKMMELVETLLEVKFEQKENIVVKFEKVFEVCKQIVPLATWGLFDSSSINVPYQSFGIIPYSRITFLGDNIKKLNELVDSIWCKKNKSIYYLSRKDVENYMLSIVGMIHDQSEDVAKNDSRLRAQWEEFLNRELQTFTVWHPIYGATANQIVEFGCFTAYNVKIHQKELENVLGINNISEWKIFSDVNPEIYLMFPIKAKEKNRAVEFAKPYFELFENIAKYCLCDSPQYDIGIFNYNTLRFEQGFVFSPDGSASILSSLKGAWKPMELEKLAIDFKPLWNMVMRHIEGRTTELEKRLIGAIQWVGKANGTDSNENKLVQYIFALESLLAFRPQKEIIVPSIANQLAEFGAFIVGERADTQVTTTQKLRRKIFKDIKTIYVARSKIVHGHNDDCSMNDVLLARDVIYTLINSILSNEELLHFTSMEQLQNWVDNKKFA